MKPQYGAFFKSHLIEYAYLAQSQLILKLANLNLNVHTHPMMVSIQI